MNIAKKRATLAALGLAAILIPPAAAQQPGTALKIGLLGDFQSVYADIGGMGNLEATKMAIEGFGGTMFGKPIELITADLLNKAHVAGSIAPKWYQTHGVPMVLHLPTSA